MPSGKAVSIGHCDPRSEIFSGQGALGTYRLSTMEWAIVTATALSVAPVLELAKWLVRAGALGR